MYKVTFLPNISITVGSQQKLQLTSQSLGNSATAAQYNTMDKLYRNRKKLGESPVIPSIPHELFETKKCK